MLRALGAILPWRQGSAVAKELEEEGEGEIDAILAAATEVEVAAPTVKKGKAKAKKATAKSATALAATSSAESTSGRQEESIATSATAAAATTVAEAAAVTEAGAATLPSTAVDCTLCFSYSGKFFTGDAVADLCLPPHNFSETLGGAVSASFCARWDSLNSDARIIDFGCGPSEDSIVISSLGEALVADIFRGTKRKRVLVPAALSVGRMYRFLFSVEESGHMRLFRDGELLAELVSGYALKLVARSHFFVGGAAWNNGVVSCGLRGHIADLRVWRGSAGWEVCFPESAKSKKKKKPKDPAKIESDQLPIAEAADVETQAHTGACDVSLLAVDPTPDVPEASSETEQMGVASTECRQDRAAVFNQAWADIEEDDEPSQEACIYEPLKNDSTGATDRTVEAIKASVDVIDKENATIDAAAPAPPCDAKIDSDVAVTAAELQSKQGDEVSADKTAEAIVEAVIEEAPAAASPAAKVAADEAVMAKAAPAGAAAKKTAKEAANASANAVVDVEAPVVQQLTERRPNRNKAIPKTGDREEPILPTPNACDVEAALAASAAIRRSEEQLKAKANVNVVKPAPDTQEADVIALPSGELDKEVLKLEKKVREIERLKQRLTSGETLDALQHEKIAREGVLRSTLTEWRARLDEERKLSIVADEQDATHCDASQGWGGAPGLPGGDDAPKGRTPLRVPKSGEPVWEPRALGFAPLQEHPELLAPGLAPPLQDCTPGERLLMEVMNKRSTPRVPGQRTPLTLPSQKVPEFQVDALRNEACWEWMETGWCPRGFTCRWEHPPLVPSTSSGNIPFWPAEDDNLMHLVPLAFMQGGAMPQGGVYAIPCGTGPGMEVTLGGMDPGHQYEGGMMPHLDLVNLQHHDAGISVEDIPDTP